MYVLIYSPSSPEESSKHCLGLNDFDVVSVHPKWQPGVSQNGLQAKLLVCNTKFRFSGTVNTYIFHCRGFAVEYYMLWLLSEFTLETVLVRKY